MPDSPEVVAAADLSPVSPKPINLSSPIVVPTLQDQADILCTMPLSPTYPVGAESTDPANLPVPDVITTHQDVSNAALQETQTAEMLNQTGEEYEDSGIEEDQQPAIVTDSTADTDDYAKNFDSPAEVVADEHQDVSKDYESTNVTAASILLTSLSAADAVSEDVPRVSVQSLAEPTSEPIASPPPQTDNANMAHADPIPNEAGQAASPATHTHAVSEDPATEAVSAGDAIDIQALVDNITARAVASDATQSSPTVADGTSTNLPPPNASSSLPPRPPVSQQPTPSYMRPEDIRKFQPAASLPAAPSSLPSMPPAQAPGVPYTYGAPGTIPEMHSSYAAPPPSAMNVAPSPASASLPQFHPTPTAAPGNGQQFDEPQRYDTFLQEERSYVSEAKWDRFPEGSRLFIGNLSSERVSKREVFDIFSNYGRLAQISLKTAYGFVQYYDVSEGQAAMDNLQGIEIKGRKIHLEISRAQKKDGGDGDKQRGPRGGGRGGNQGDRDRQDGRRRDDYRPRSSSPRRAGHQRQDSHGRDRGGHWEAGHDSRGRRSRSPPGFSAGGYRRRSPSPYRRGPPASEADLDIPRRYAGEVPDVQLLLLQEVDRAFVDWVQRGFVDYGLKVAVMFLNPRFPRELVIQRQIVEGVHAVTELDYRAQQAAKIPLQVFDRSAGRQNVRFDQYQDLDPAIAAQLVARAKTQVQPQQSGGYGNGHYQPSPYQPAPQPYHGQPAAPAGYGNLAALGNLDPATLQKVLAAVQATPQGAPHGQPMNAAPDVNTILGALGGGHGGAPSHAPHQHPGYAPGPPANSPPSGNPGESSQHVQNIMAQLARYRQ